MARFNIIPRLALVATATYFAQQAFLGARPAARSSKVIRRAEEKSSGSDRVQLKVLSPEGSGITETVSEVVLPSASGQLGVLANHAPMMSALDIGVLRYKQNGQWKPLVTYGGFAQVDSNVLSILVNDFETVDGIDTNQAKKDLEEATAKLEKADSKKDKLDATTAVKKASARLQAAMFGKK
jgi:F-type H+-transporting ATPase subunit epsilon